MRINEPFGDTVNWDLIPLSAISSINLIPGSNPVFGLNTLGGALAIHTKSGFEYPGYSIKSSGGSFGRKQVEFEAGGHGKYTDYFVTGNFFDEDGFSDHSPSRVRQVFGKIGVQDGRTDFDLSFTGADNALEGAQTLPLSFLSNPNQAYTFPDRNTNRLLFFNLKGSHFINDNNLLAGNIYYRKYKNGNFSSNVNDNFDPLMPIAAGNTTAFNDVNSINQDGYGGSLQFTYLGDVLSRKNQFTAGLSLDAAGTEFAQFEQEALFTAERGTVAFSPNFALQTRVGSSTRNYGVYLTNNISITDQINLTTSGRFNRAQVKIRDETGLTPALNGDSVFTRFNPAVGLNYNPVKSFTTYAAYNEGLRAPSPVELTCADPAAPCRLPNNFLADPPLKPVISKTWEIGARGVSQGGIGWTTSVFRTDLRDDIQFISSGGAVNAGFFQNVGTTRRQGLELGVFTKASRWKLSGNYSYLDATFRTPFVINSVNNSSANAAGDIQVLAGNRIPGLPRHNLKARAEYAFTEKLSAGVNLVGFTR
ncbi:MAG: TonB-dependent receptor, partial [Pseudomonas sp.]